MFVTGFKTCGNFFWGSASFVGNSGEGCLGVSKTVPEAHFALKVCAHFQPYFSQITIWQHGFCIHLVINTE